MPTVGCNIPRVLALAAVLGPLGTCGGCDKSQPAGYRPVRERDGFLAVVGVGRDDPVWPVLRSSAERFDRDFGKYEVRYEAPPTSSTAEQIKLIDRLIALPMRGLCVQVDDPAPFGPVIDRARQNGVQVVTMLRRAGKGRLAGHVGVDEADVGRALAEATARYVGGPGAIMVLHADASDPELRRRHEGFTEAMHRHLAIEIWASVDCGGDPRTARGEVVERSARFPTLSVWVSMAPWPLLEVPADAPALAPGTRVITVGAEPPMWPLIESGVCPVVVALAYYDAGLKALQFCQTAAAEPSTPPSEYVVPTRLVFSSGLAEYKRDWAWWSQPPTRR